ncbi:MAG: hypothetical protein FWF03_04640, partial [Defluviitaleaceae bacterium]|nr:hypothetical protein [Defluviitaleaceae bacterium]
MDDFDYIKKAESHFDAVIENGTDVYGGVRTPAWMSSLDVSTGSYADRGGDLIQEKESLIGDPLTPEGCAIKTGKRVYRNVDAPRGCSLYWDQPLLAAARTLGEITGNEKYAGAADGYASFILENCVAPNGTILWGNHYYYDAFLDSAVRFEGDEPPRPCDMENESGELHEMRPVVPDWDALAIISPYKTERHIRRVLEGHIFDMPSVAFNRHADGRRGCAFLESGGILAESACWLYKQTGDATLLGDALKVARYSFGNRGGATGLLENNPTGDRWDKYVCTTEVGHFAGRMLSCGEYSRADEFYDIADAATRAYLRFGFDKISGRYYGRLRVSDGSPVIGSRETVFQPGDYSNIWEPVFPTHDYALAFAETCVRLYRLTRSDIYKTAILRWAEIIRAESPPSDGGYAEHYGRQIRFLAEAGCAVGGEIGESLQKQARSLAAEAASALWAGRMFRGRAGSGKCDAVDGMGNLLLALLRLQT